MHLRALHFVGKPPNRLLKRLPKVKPSACNAAIALVVISLAGCSFAPYPTKLDVDLARPTVPSLETIADGRAYLVVVRNELITERDNLRNLDTGLAAGIVGGLVTTALATTLKWGHHTQVAAGILSAAVIGVESTLSLKTQQQIINRGLDALLCVESQAEVSYLAVKQRDVVLGPVADDIRALEAAIAAAANVQDEALAKAAADLADAKAWFSRVSLPVAAVNAAVKIAVNSVLQTTIDQLNAVLPDGAAFAKISLTPLATPAATATPATPAVRTGQTSSATNRAFVQGEISPREAYFASFVTKLHADMKIAEAALRTLPPAAVLAFPSIQCAVAGGVPVVPLSVSPTALTLALPVGRTAVATIIGGAPPYKGEITVAAGSSELNPKAIQVDVSGVTVTLTNTALLKKGTYNLVMTDASGAQKTIIVTAANQ